MPDPRLPPNVDYLDTGMDDRDEDAFEEYDPPDTQDEAK